MHVAHKYTNIRYFQLSVTSTPTGARLVSLAGWCGHSGVVGPRIGAHSIGDDILAVTFAAVLVGLLFLLLFFFPL